MTLSSSLYSRSCLLSTGKAFIQSIKNIWYRTARSPVSVLILWDAFLPASAWSPEWLSPWHPGEWQCQNAGEFNQQDFCRGWAEAWKFSEARRGKWPWDSSQGEINACLWQLFSETTTPQARAVRQERCSFPAASLCVWWELRHSHSLGWWWHTSRSDQ